MFRRVQRCSLKTLEQGILQSLLDCHTSIWFNKLLKNCDHKLIMNYTEAALNKRNKCKKISRPICNKPSTAPNSTCNVIE